MVSLLVALLQLVKLLYYFRDNLFWFAFFLTTSLSRVIGAKSSNYNLFCVVTTFIDLGFRYVLSGKPCGLEFRVQITFLSYLQLTDYFAHQQLTGLDQPFSSKHLLHTHVFGMLFGLLPLHLRLVPLRVILRPILIMPLILIVISTPRKVWMVTPTWVI